MKSVQSVIHIFVCDFNTHTKIVITFYTFTHFNYVILDDKYMKPGDF